MVPPSQGERKAGAELGRGPGWWLHDDAHSFSLNTDGWGPRRGSDCWSRVSCMGALLSLASVAGDLGNAVPAARRWATAGRQANAGPAEGASRRRYFGDTWGQDVRIRAWRSAPEGV